MTAPAYTEISHFRAPYKNWPHLGVGPSVAGRWPMSGIGELQWAAAGFGATAAPSATASPIAPDLSPVQTQDGVRVFRPQVADAVLTMLQAFSVIFLTNDSVKIEPAVPGDVRQKASDWIKQKLAEGKTIIAGSPAGIQAFVTPVVVDRTLESVKGADAEKDKAGPNTLPLTAVLVRPSGLAKAGLMGPVGIAVLALAGVGLVAYLATRKRHRAKPNRARRHAVTNRRRRRRRR